jgi:hypothetical protein
MADAPLVRFDRFDLSRHLAPLLCGLADEVSVSLLTETFRKAVASVGFVAHFGGCHSTTNQKRRLAALTHVKADTKFSRDQPGFTFSFDPGGTLLPEEGCRDARLQESLGLGKQLARPRDQLGVVGRQQSSPVDMLGDIR